MIFQEGIVTFKGCCWDAKWDYDFPTALYSPVKRYGLSSQLHEKAFRNLVITLCDTLVDEEQVRNGFTTRETKVFEHHRWTFDLKRKKSAIHGEIRVRFFFNQAGGKDYEVLD